MKTIDELIAKAEESAAQPKSYGYGAYAEGIFQVYVVPVQQRTRIMRQHYRATFYLRQGPNGGFYRVNRKAFAERLASVQSRENLQVSRDGA